MTPRSLQGWAKLFHEGVVFLKAKGWKPERIARKLSFSNVAAVCEAYWRPRNLPGDYRRDALNKLLQEEGYFTPKAVVTIPQGPRERSTVKDPVQTCWDVFDSMKLATRRERIAAAMRRGVSYGTAARQHSNWKKYGPQRPSLGGTGLTVGENLQLNAGM